MQSVEKEYFEHLVRTDYVRRFSWLGRPILQLPTDLMALQEIIWQIRPDFIIETGVAFGGMTVFFASMLENIGKVGQVIGIDIHIGNINKRELLLHTLWHRIKLMEGSSTDLATIQRVREYTADGKGILIALDSNHTHDHVLQELRLYSPLVSLGSYIVVFDTAIEFFGHLDKNQDRPWCKGNNPWTAVQEFMAGNDEFIVDTAIEERIILTSAPGGWLKRAKEAS